MGYDTKLKKVSENAFEVLQFEIEKKKKILDSIHNDSRLFL